MEDMSVKNVLCTVVRDRLDWPRIVVWNDEIVKNISSGRAEDAKWDADLANMKALLANSKRIQHY